jgi:gas vesicle protein
MFERRNQWAATVPAFLIGIGFGTAVGMLLAPKSGAKTRRLISGAARQGLDEAVATGQRWARRASDAANQVRDQIDQVTESVKGAAEAGQRAYNEVVQAGSESPYDAMNRRSS